MNIKKSNASIDGISFVSIRSNYTNQTKNISKFSLNQTYINSRECPHCGSHHVLSNGNYKGRKRYLCKDCGKSYNDLTNTPFSGIHNLGKIMKYLDCLINGDSIRKAALIVDVSITTSFFWRHKLLNGLNRLPAPKMKNVKEMMEIELPYSHKGQRSKLSVSQHNSKISALFICDRTGKVDSDSIALTYRDLNPLLTRIIEKSNEHTDLICSTKFENIMKYSNLNIKTPNTSYSQPHLITKIIATWQNWMQRFRGVASRYLANYLHWFDYLDNSILSVQRNENLLKLLLRH